VFRVQVSSDLVVSVHCSFHIDYINRHQSTIFSLAVLIFYPHTCIIREMAPTQDEQSEALRSELLETQRKHDRRRDRKGRCMKPERAAVLPVATFVVARSTARSQGTDLGAR
jgi:hypothetical protein